MPRRRGRDRRLVRSRTDDAERRVLPPRVLLPLSRYWRSGGGRFHWRRSWWQFRRGDLSGSGVLSAKQGAPVAARGGGPVIMEHFLLDVAAAPLRLIAAKNEKSRSELGRFLVKQVREGEGRERVGPSPPPPGARPVALREDAGDRRAVSCHSGPFPKAGQWRRRPRAFEEPGRSLLLFILWESIPFSPPIYFLAAPWLRAPNVTFREERVLGFFFGS